MNLVDEDVYIKSQLLMLNIQQAARSEGALALEEDAGAKVYTLRILSQWADDIKQACDREVKLWENLEKWLQQQNGNLKG